jgi:hypothetical protein
VLEQAISLERESRRELRTRFQYLIAAQIVKLVDGQRGRAFRMFADVHTRLAPMKRRHAAVLAAQAVTETRNVGPRREERALHDATLLDDEQRELHFAVADLQGAHVSVSRAKPPK